MLKTKTRVFGDTIVIHDSKLKEFSGQEITVNILFPSAKKTMLDFDSYVIPSDRANFADEYIKSIRNNDRF